jgi:precorrin-6B methylase 2
MANPLKDVECEAVSLLAAAHPEAFVILTDYFERMYEKEKTACVDCNMSNIEIHRGKARAWKDAKNIYTDAINMLNV